MVFISMSPSDLLPRTAQYQMRDLSPLQESEDPEPFRSDDVNQNRPVSRRRDSSVQRTVPPPISNSAARNYRRGNARSNGTSAYPIPLIELRDEAISSSQTCHLPEPPDFTVTSSCNDLSSDEEEPSSPATLADRLRRDSLPSPHELSSDEDTEVGLERAMQRNLRDRRSSRRAEPSKIEIVDNADVGGDGIENREVLAPHARFFIEQTRSVVSVKFDPPV